MNGTVLCKSAELHTLGQTRSLSIISDLCFPLPGLSALPASSQPQHGSWFPRRKPDLALPKELCDLSHDTAGMGVSFCVLTQSPSYRGREKGPGR